VPADDEAGAVGVDVVAALGAAVGAAAADVPADGVNDGLPADVPFDVDAAATAVSVSGAARSAGSAVSVSASSRSASQVLSAEVIACRLPCRSLLRPLSPVELSPVEPAESADRPLPLPIVSAGSGAVALDPASALSSPAVAADAAVAASPEEEESPLAPTRCDAPEREFPVLARDGDMMPLSTNVSAASPSGSAFRLAGAMMSGG
jgi:hypothetical protein